jgi:hypothetical protein
LGAAGDAWWKWAWKTPTAAAWTEGDLYAVARRATLEDALDRARSKPNPSARAIGDLASLCLRTDEALGLTPKGRKALGWTVDTPDTAPPLRAVTPVAIDDFRKSLE